MSRAWAPALLALPAAMGGAPLAGQGVSVLDLVRTRLNAVSAVGVGTVVYWTDTQFVPAGRRGTIEGRSSSLVVAASITHGFSSA